jgi:(2R)-ethylmalonyl-CoA mutase
VKESKRIPESEFPLVVGRISFFVNAGIRFIEENAKMRAFNVMWDQICQERYQVTDEKLRRFRYGVQVNSLGLTEQQPENNVPRIVLESLGVLLSRDARARALQLPAWNEALGLPRPWDQQWSLRIQQILALETDLLDYPDIFEGSIVMDSLVNEIVQGATVELEEILSAGGVFSFIDELKSRLVRSQSERTSKIEKGELAVVGVNRFVNTEPSPLSESKLGTHLVIDPKVEAEMVEATKAWRLKRNSGEVEDKLLALKAAAKSDDNLMEATIQLALVGGTTGEWARALREVFGEYRAPTGVSGGFGQREAILRDLASSARSLDGGPPRLLVAKPGLDGHSNGAEQIAVAARDAGFEVIYQGIRLTPHQIAVAARDEDVDLVGISILSGSHLELVPQIIAELAEQGSEALVVVGGIIPEADQKVLIEAGVARIYTPKDYEISQIMHDLLELTVIQRVQISNV